ncbi:hypothetical protein B0J17DRAFT_632427 [Rhizoctonia solani]|nr:hypothetical protein B0J17DRAFT_632427 [Rhizoctonia solani]
MHTTHNTLSALPSLLISIPQVPKSPYPVSRKSMAPVTPARKAYSQLNSMFSTLKPSKTAKRQETTAVVELSGDKGHALDGQLALMHANNSQARRCAMLASTGVPGGQLASGHPMNTHFEPPKTTIRADEFYGRAQVARTSARFISTLLDCPESLPSTDPTGAALTSLTSSPPHSTDPVSPPVSITPQPRLYTKACTRHISHCTHAASKQSQDGVYSIGDWAFIGQDIFEPSQLRDNEWRMCERLEWRFLVHPMDLVKLAWTIEMEYGELSEGSLLRPLSLEPNRSPSLNSPWSGWGAATPSGSSFSTPGSGGVMCDSTVPSPFVLA